jgi:hypothetical protein
MVMAMYAFATGGVSGRAAIGASDEPSSSTSATVTVEGTTAVSSDAVAPPTGTDLASPDTAVRNTVGGITDPTAASVDEVEQTVPISAGLGLPPSNTYPYHSNGPDWPGLNTSDPRCAAVLADQRILELPDMVGLTLPQALASADPIGMYSYCTNGTIIELQFATVAEVCTTNSSQFDQIAAQTPAPGTRVKPGGFPVRLTFYRDCPVDTGTPTTTAPPTTPTTPPVSTSPPTTPTTPATTPATVPVSTPVTAAPATGDPTAVDPGAIVPAGIDPAGGAPATADTTTSTSAP